jgi:hypothetical protein
VELAGLALTLREQVGQDVDALLPVDAAHGLRRSRRPGRCPASLKRVFGPGVGLQAVAGSRRMK